MDAAYTTLKKTALFLTVALLLAAPFSAQAQPAFTFPGPNGSNATVTANQGAEVPVGSTGAPITFTATQVAAASGVVDPGLSITPNSATTPVTLTINTSNVPATVTSGTHTILITLQATSPSGVTDGTITVTWNANGNSGGGGGNTGSGLTINVPGNPITLTSSGGSIGYNTFTLTNSTSQTITYGITTTYTPNTDPTWLLIPGGTVGAGQTATVTVQGNPANLTNGTHTATFSIQYSPATNNGVGTIVNIPVSFAVNSNTSGNGSLTANPNAVSWNYSTTSGASLGTQIPNQNVTIASSTGASTYSFVVNPTGSNGYLLVANGQINASGIAIGTPLQLTPLSNISSLSTGTYQETISVTDSNQNTTLITVNISVNGAQNTGITLSPAPISLSAALGQNAQATVTLTSDTSGTVNLTVTGSGLTLANSSNTQSISVTAGSPTTFIVYGTAGSLAANTYIGSVTATEGTVTQTDQVNFVVGGSSGGNTSGVVAPTSLQFVFEQGQVASGTSTSLLTQNITDSVAGSFTTQVTSGSNFLTVTPSGTGPGLISVSISNVTGMAAGTYTGAFTVTTPQGSQNVSVNLLIAPNTSPVIFANPPTLNISYVGGSSSPQYTVNVLSSDGTAIPYTASSSQSWLTIQQYGSATGSSFLQLTVNGSSLSNGLNVANITITSAAADTSLVVPVAVSVSGSTNTGGGSLTLGTSSLTFSAAVNGSAPGAQTLSITAPVNTNYTATTSTSSGGSWLSISPSGSLSTGSTSSLSVTVNQSGLAAGTYQGNINLATSAGTQTVPVTLVVSGATTGNVTVSPTALTFNYQSGGTLPGAQGVNVTNASGSGASLSYSVGVTTQTGGSWLSAAPQTGVTGQAFSVSVSPTGLAAGTYTGSVTVTPNGGTAVTIPVTLVVQGLPTVSASPATLSLPYQAGSTNTPTATIQVSGSAANLSFTANASSTGGWLAVSPTSGTTGTNGATLTVSVNPAGLNPGTYTGTVVVSGTSGATGSSTTTITLTVSAPLPTITAVQNAASGAGGPVSPGEIVSIFAPAANPIGPGTPVGLTLDANGNVSTTLGGVQVLFNGTPAPLTYVSSTQINAVVPYNVAGLSLPYVQVKYLNQSSNAFNLTATSTAPGIFTQNGSGTGPGAILNQDGSTNGSSGATKPAPKGSVVAVYMTGEGATSPTGITGKVNCPTGQACTVQQLPVPLLPVSVTLIDSTGARYPANFIFAGEAPGFVSGLMQVNVVIPTTVPSGTLQMVIAVGNNTSQSGVTVAVQ